jgi:hypothetical protein
MDENGHNSPTALVATQAPSANLTLKQSSEVASASLSSQLHFLFGDTERRAMSQCHVF